MEMKAEKIKQTKITGQTSASLLVVNMRGLVNTRRPVRRTLQELRLLKRFNATIVPDNEVFRGMLESAKEHLAWCELDARTAENLLTKRAESSNGNKVSESILKGSGFSSFADLASALASGKASLSADFGFRQFFRLSPPKGGFNRSIRRQFGEGGVLGPNKELEKLVERMI
jgi:large subunit ribosomal protein L30